MCGMPRPARLVVPDQPHHVTQRGNRRQRTFFRDEDYALYVSLLRHACAKTDSKVWAWCLMPNHVHLILVPSCGDGLASALGPLHRRYSVEVNQREGWSGHLWQSRFASFPLDEAHLHACLRYVELNPVRAGLVERPEDWPWSSARGHLGLASDRLTDPAPARARVEDWRAFLDVGLDPHARADLRLAERRGRLAPTNRPRTD
jgi:putative transposase